MIVAGPDGVLVVEDETVEVLAWDGPVELGVGAVGWIHAGVVVDVQPGAVAYLAPGAQYDPVTPGAAERGDVTVTPWRARQTPPAGTVALDEATAVGCVPAAAYHLGDAGHVEPGGSVSTWPGSVWGVRP